MKNNVLSENKELRETVFSDDVLIFFFLVQIFIC